MQKQSAELSTAAAVLCRTWQRPVFFFFSFPLSPFPRHPNGVTVQSKAEQSRAVQIGWGGGALLGCHKCEKKEKKKDIKVALANVHVTKVMDVGGDAEWDEAERNLVVRRDKKHQQLFGL